MSINEITFEGGDQGFARGCCDALVAAIQESLQARGKCVVGLSGGSTPKDAFKLLGEIRSIDWDKVTHNAIISRIESCDRL